ncbi:MAG TPA: phage late control D family protein, partial [Polyangiaceae bacterium]|nr:phage late control D family protein [Polyangiaceae bacterium]
MGLIKLRLECAALPSPREYQIVACKLFEGISRPTRASVTISSETRFDELTLLDAAATFRAQHDHSERQWSFLVDAARYTGFRDERHQYVVELTHPVAILGRRHNTRAFQKRPLRKIVEELLAGCNIAADQLIWKMGEDPTREYIVQYRESDLALLQRLLFEDGANYLLTF